MRCHATDGSIAATGAPVQSARRGGGAPARRAVTVALRPHAVARGEQRGLRAAAQRGGHLVGAPQVERALGLPAVRAQAVRVLPRAPGTRA